MGGRGVISDPHFRHALFAVTDPGDKLTQGEEVEKNEDHVLVAI